MYLTREKSSLGWLWLNNKLERRMWTLSVVATLPKCHSLLNRSWEPSHKPQTEAHGRKDEFGWPSVLGQGNSSQKRFQTLRQGAEQGLIPLVIPTGPSAQHPQLELERGWWRNMPRRAQVGFHSPKLSGSRPLHNACQPLLYEVIHKGNVLSY